MRWDHIYFQIYERPKWGRQREFLFTIAGSVIGLGNVWRFPYLWEVLRNLYENYLSEYFLIFVDLDL